MGDIEEMLRDLPERTFQAGEVVIREGEPLFDLYFLWSGTLDVTKQDVEVHTVSVRGAVFGEMSYLLEKDPMATVTAATDCVLKVVTDRDLFLSEHPHLALYMARICAARLDSVVQYLVDIKAQFPDHVHHFTMMDEILDSIINKHPRKIAKELRPQDLVDD